MLVLIHITGPSRYPVRENFSRLMIQDGCAFVISVQQYCIDPEQSLGHIKDASLNKSPHSHVIPGGNRDLGQEAQDI